MPAITFKEVVLDTSSEDRNGRLVFADDILFAVIVQLVTEHGDVAKPGDWFLEAGFGACAGSGEVFASLEDVRAWVLQQIGSNQSPPRRSGGHDAKSAKPPPKRRAAKGPTKVRFGTVEEHQKMPPATLGDVLGLDGASSEHDWAELVQSIAAGDQGALHALYERTHRLVFTLATRITANREAAEDVTRNVFHALWRCASHYDATNGTVLAWVMNQARSSAIQHLRISPQNVQPDAERDAHGILELRAHGQDLQASIAQRIFEDIGMDAVPPRPHSWPEPKWTQVAPGIECKVLSTDTKRHRISMVVHLAPGAGYPAHTHAAEEELHLLDGVLWIDGRKLLPGDYNYGSPGATDERVWTETGCTCVLVTSTKDVLRLKRTG